jgi:hypothetical protein
MCADIGELPLGFGRKVGRETFSHHLLPRQGREVVVGSV